MNFSNNLPRNFLVQRLKKLTDLRTEEIDGFGDLCQMARTIPADRAITDETQEPNRLHILLDGWAARCKPLRDGRRQFPMLLLPGDICDTDALHAREMDYNVVALTACRVAIVQRADLLATIRRFPAIGDALTWLTFVENGILSEALACHGRRSAREHLAHLLCELHARLDLVGLADANGFTLPITQEDVADTMGMTAVHVNRTFQALRADGLVEVRHHRVTFTDPALLARIASFDPRYLHGAGMRPRVALAA